MVAKPSLDLNAQDVLQNVQDVQDVDALVEWEKDPEYVDANPVQNPLDVRVNPVNLDALDVDVHANPVNLDAPDVDVPANLVNPVNLDVPDVDLHVNLDALDADVQKKYLDVVINIIWVVNILKVK